MKSNPHSNVNHRAFSMDELEGLKKGEVDWSAMEAEAKRDLRKNKKAIEKSPEDYEY